MKIETKYSRGKLKNVCIIPEDDEEESFLERINNVKPRITITYTLDKPNDNPKQKTK